VATALGAQVIAVDIDDAKLEKAKQEGAVHVVNARKENVPEAIKDITKGGANVSIDALGIRDTVLNSVMSLRKGGRHVQVGLTTSEEGGMVSLPVDMITAMELEFVLNPKSLVTEEVGLEEVSRVFEDMSHFRTMGFHVITRF
jgi:propanol-preferring alcohol dehydrogenase